VAGARGGRSSPWASCPGAPTRITAAEALRGLEIMMAMYESAHLGRMVDFPLAQEAFPPGRADML